MATTTGGGDGLLGDLARMQAGTPAEADALRTKLEMQARLASYEPEGSKKRLFERLGARTVGQQALVIDHYEGRPPHSELVERREGDAVLQQITPVRSIAGCLACADELRNDGQEFRIQ